MEKWKTDRDVKYTGKITYIKVVLKRGYSCTQLNHNKVN